MKRMNNKEVKQMLTFFSSSIDFENLNLDDEKTYELFQNAETDGIYMMESEWDKYDLLQIKPHNIDELTATIAFSHGITLNPYIYTYLKIQKIHPFTYPQFTEMDRVKEILRDTHGMLLWKEQKEEILAYIGSLTDEEKEKYKTAIKIVLHEIESRKHSLPNRMFFYRRALLCYKLAYIKSHMPIEFEQFRTRQSM